VVALVVSYSYLLFYVFSNLFTGSQIGILVGMQGSGILCKRYGWESAFYVFGKNYLCG